ncbi:MAG: cysteine hydrolase [Lachnospiraceae bacterium]|nr:cysteine hydrolase [Lachnospiraceae bacterium]
MSDKKAVIVIDLQKDYLWDKRKPMFTYDTEKLIGNVNAEIRAYKEKGYDIIYIKHILPKLLWGVGFSIEGSEGAELYEGLDVVSDLCFEKNRSDSYSSKLFREYMKKNGYSEVILMGLDECGCVGATAKGAAKTGINVKILEACIASRFPEKKIVKMREQLRRLGIEYI